MTSLTLVKDQRYFAAVQAQNTVGLWSQVGVSDAVVAGVDSLPFDIYLPLTVRSP